MRNLIYFPFICQSQCEIKIPFKEKNQEKRIKKWMKERMKEECSAWVCILFIIRPFLSLVFAWISFMQLVNTKITYDKPSGSASSVSSCLTELFQQQRLVRMKETRHPWQKPRIAVQGNSCFYSDRNGTESKKMKASGEKSLSFSFLLRYQDSDDDEEQFPSSAESFALNLLLFFGSIPSFPVLYPCPKKHWLMSWFVIYYERREYVFPLVGVIFTCQWLQIRRWLMTLRVN